ncbi:hypothetical protein [Variovorax sp. PCZ-1]|uniref:hypothetical protein n=1 Tax=Variovorax sp. PCZ-1 TaxID=2835533 RepID=UPI001BD15227|nr:hypothetical protein [Variovorax sp. PCZ-1]MBS7808639.1 hypothetical protein [Variovorax sp. PCZ-1]
MSDLKSLRRSALIAVPLLAVAALSACVIVPMDPKTGRPYESATQPPVVVVQQPTPAASPGIAAPQWQTVQARLYPVNEAARNAGILQATVIDNGAGRGSFSVTYQGQALQGEATRVDRQYPGFGQIMSQVQGGVNWAQAAGQRGIANAASSSYSLRCEYLFTAATQGTGACLASDGARYQIHFGS